MKARSAVSLLAAGAALLGPAAGAAHAFYGNGARIVSASDERQEEGDDNTNFAAISQNGRYVAFDTRAGNFFADTDPDQPGKFRRGGIFRRDLGSGALELVADGDLYDENTPNDIERLGAHAPSISADGRYVAFYTNQQLVPADVNDAGDVYRRDMTIPIRAPGAYTLVSARDGTDVPATYAAPATARPGRNPGTQTWPGAALSADGNRVVFSAVEVNSDLPASGSVNTPPDQVLVRDISAKKTQLVTRTVDATPQPAGGASGPAGISADGSTVVWTGTNAAGQTFFFNGESAPRFQSYYLWQRLAGGPTRRLTGATDPDDPSCSHSSFVSPSETATGPCYGPLTGAEEDRNGIANVLPALSADGYRAAFLVSTGPRPNDLTPAGLDLWVTDMHPGVSRKAGSRELSREGLRDSRSSAGIDGLAMSADGRRIALSTARGSWVLPGITPIGSFRALPNARDVALIDLGDNTVQRVTRGYDGSDTNGGSDAQPSLSGDGTRVAFTSTASNFFFGDANEKSDAFVATLTPEPDAPPPPPPAATPPPEVTEETPPDAPRISVKARHQRDGTVKLVVRVPGAGLVAASARGKPPRARRTTKLASARRHATKPGDVVLRLRLARRYRAALARGTRVRASARVDFSPPSGKPLHRTVRVTFSLQKRRKK